MFNEIINIYLNSVISMFHLYKSNYRQQCFQPIPSHGSFRRFPNYIQTVTVFYKRFSKLVCVIKLCPNLIKTVCSDFKIWANDSFSVIQNRHFWDDNEWPICLTTFFALYNKEIISAKGNKNRNFETISKMGGGGSKNVQILNNLVWIVQYSTQWQYRQKLLLKSTFLGSEYIHGHCQGKFDIDFFKSYKITFSKQPIYEKIKTT